MDTQKTNKQETLHKAVVDLYGELFDFASLDGETFVGLNRTPTFNDLDDIAATLATNVLKASRRWLSQRGALFTVLRGDNPRDAVLDRDSRALAMHNALNANIPATEGNGHGQATDT